jgi:predicted nucleotidyltransferase component of viral defense system
MINRASLTHGSSVVPWTDNAQVEQDLIICRALVAIFSDDFLSSQLAFRGGTALHKLYLSPQPRYLRTSTWCRYIPGDKGHHVSVGEVLDFLPDRVTKQKRYNNTMLFRMESEIPPTIQIRLKVEINCYEHFNVLGLMKHPFEVENSWFSGKAELTTYNYNELLGTKLRALYQRKKGRDLFDLYTALTQRECNEDEIIVCYKKYMSFVVDNPPTYKQFVHNMELKMQDADFLAIRQPYTTRTHLHPHEAYAL